MDIIKRDQNSRTIGAGVSSTDSTNVLMIRVDPVTNYVLADITAVGNTSANATNIAKRDENNKPVYMGYNELTGEVEEILTDTEGRILCDLLLT